MLEARTHGHYFEYGQSGKVPMAVATLSILRQILAIVSFESEDMATHRLWVEYVGKDFYLPT